MMYSLLMILAVIAVSAAAKSSYVKGKLSYEPSSLYEYSLSGEMHDQRGKEVAVITCKVKLQCMSEGTYGGKKAVHYCIEMENVIQTFFEVQINQVTFKQTKYLKSAKDLTRMMEKDFCFLRSEDGLLLKVLYPRNESKEVINLKKTIVSAFQANFAKTEKKVETDSQSKHVSHYKYETKGDNTVEHRTVNSEDVSKYSGKTGKKGVDYRSKEDVEVDKNKIIRKAYGKSTTSLTKVDQEEEKITGKNSDIPSIETKTKYTLKLIKKVPRVAEAEEDEQQDKEATVMDDIIAQYDEYEHDVADMEELHEQLTDIQVMAKRMTRSVQTKKESDMESIEQHAHTMQNWRELLHLESKHGPLNNRESTLKALIGKLEEVGLDKSDHSYNLRMIIYDLLSSEGSIMAQQALINALRMKQMAELDEEYHSIVTAITLLESVELASLFDYKKYVMANGTIDEQLLLSLATLGRHKNVEKEVVDTITQLMEEQGVNDTDTLIYFIHALGNTGSRLIIPHLMPLLLNTDIQVTVIDALRTVSTDKRVQAVFSDLCRSSDVSADTVLAIIESLRFPHESFLYHPEPPEEPEVQEVGKQLITNIVNAAIQIHDDTLYNATQTYLQATATDFTKSLLNDLIVRYNENSTESQSISKRAYTRDWSSRQSGMFNSVARYTRYRRADKRNYPFHKAFSWNKKLGPSKIHARIAVGGFAGAGRSGIKVLGKAVIKLYCFGRTYTAMEGYYMTQYNTRVSRIRKYVKVLGRTVLNQDKTTRLRYSKSWTKNFASRRLFSFRKRIFVKVGFLTFTIRGDVRVGAKLSVYVKPFEAKSDVQFGPTFIINGGAHLTIARYRIGLKASASIGYYITPKASVTMCDTKPKADVSTCFGIFHGSNGLNVNVYAYYKKYGCRVIRRRRGWRWSWRWSCKWSRENRLGSLSSTYRIRALSQRLYKGQCAACSCGGALRRFCSAHTGTPGGASSCSCRSTGFQ